MTLNKTKIIATLGPSSTEKPILKTLIENGVNVFRVNFSHANHDEVKNTVLNIREISSSLDLHVAILGDLQGPKIRLGNVKEGVVVENKALFSITTNAIELGDSNLVSINYKDFPKDVSKGEKVLVDDGKIILEIIETNKKDLVKVKVVQGGVLKSKKGVNLPNTKLSLPALTEKDKSDALFAIKNNFDWLALSFVRSKEDVCELEGLISQNSKHKIPIIAKIEKPEAILNLDAILHAADGLMVARGDLGLEIPAEEVPLKQKLMVNKAKKARKPIIIATQMMESMIDSLTPSRAEVNDVANSVMDGADAVMLSGETSVGKYPVQCIKMLKNIAAKTENFRTLGYEKFLTDTSDWQNIAIAARDLATRINADGIVVVTRSGQTADVISSTKPFRMPIHAFTNNQQTFQQLSLVGGMQPYFMKSISNQASAINKIKLILASNVRAKKSLKFVLIGGVYSASHSDSIQIITT